MDEINGMLRVYHLSKEVIGILVSHGLYASLFLNSVWWRDREGCSGVQRTYWGVMAHFCGSSQNLNHKTKAVRSFILHLYFTSCYCEIICPHHCAFYMISFCIALNFETKSKILLWWSSQNWDEILLSSIFTQPWLRVTEKHWTAMPSLDSMLES